MPPRPDPPNTRSTRKPPASASSPAQPISRTTSTFIPAVVSASSPLSSASPLPPPPPILTSHAITRHQVKVSKKARLDYITFSSGIDGTLPTSTASTSSSATSTFSPNTSHSSTRKRTFQDHSTGQTQTQSQRVTGSKQPRLTAASKPSSSTASSSTVVTRTRHRVTGAQQNHAQGIASFMRQSKMSTSQKRSNPSAKSLSKDAEESKSSDSQDFSASNLSLEADKGCSGTAGGRTDDHGVITGKQDDQDTNKTIEHSAEISESGDDKKAANDHGDEDHEEDEDDDEDNEEEDEEDEDDNEDDYDQHHRRAEQDGLFSSGGSMSGMVSGISSRLKGILNNLRAYEDPSLQLIALQDLAVLLSVSTEDTLAGYFSCDPFVKELVILMRGSGDGDDNPEIMLLACRCLSNLMEAMPASLGNIVYGGAVPVLCSKLLEIQYIDLAEQSLTTLEKISSEYPHAVVKEGGLAAILMFLDFFATNVQRTAVKTAANCCRGIQQDSISMVTDVLPNLENLLQYSDQKIVEQACLCFVRLADSYKSNAAHLQTIITENILRTIMSLLSPNANVVVGPQIYTLLLHFLSTVAEHSPTLGFVLLEMDIVDTLFLVLTGTHAPAAHGEDSGPLTVPDMGSRSKEQISEIIGIITELLPALPKDDALFDTDYRYRALKKETQDAGTQDIQREDVEMKAVASEVDKRQELLESHPDRMQRLGTILIPTLIEVYTSTVHLRVRQRAIQALVKLIYFSNYTVLKTALKNVELASFLAVILSQQEHQSLLVAALQITYILMAKIPSVYRFYFEREGVTFEISKLAYLGIELSLSNDNPGVGEAEIGPAKSIKNDGATADVKAGSTKAASESEDSPNSTNKTNASVPVSTAGKRLSGMIAELRDMRNQPEQERTMDEQLNAIEKELGAAWSRLRLVGQSDTRTESETLEERLSTLEQLRALQRFVAAGSRSVATSQKEEKGLGSGKTKEWIFERARIIVEIFETAGIDGETGAHPGSPVLSDLKRMAEGLRESGEAATKSLRELAQYFERLGATGISSFEFLNSGLVQSLLEYFTDRKDTGGSSQEERIQAFVREFMVHPQSGSLSKSATTTSYGLLVKKMQEALTRMETFEVEVAQTSLGEARNNPSSSLATQVRLKLSPEEGTEVPSGYQNLVVSIHAIATFRTLDEYLRPRLRPKLSSLEKKSGVGSDENGSSKEQDKNSKTKVKGPSPTTRRSSRLQKLAESGSEERVFSTTLQESSSDKDEEENKDADHSDLDGYSEVSDEDMEEIEYDLERKVRVKGGRGADASAIDMESDVKTSETTGLDAHTTSAKNKNHGDDCPARTESSEPTRNGRSDGILASESPSSWHIQFSLHGTPISTEMTVYGAIHEHERRNGRSASQRSLWSSVYPIKYKRVDSPPSEHSALAGNSQSNSEADLTYTAKMPKELPQHAEYASILGLLRALHALNDDWRRFFAVDEQLPKGAVLHLEPREFVNSKISAKVNRQLEEPLIVASSCLPDWTTGLVTGFPFLFPFETRYTYLQSTAFGFSRSIMRWQNQQQRNGHTDQRDDSQTILGRIQRQKVRISRQKALESAVRVMDLYGAHQAMLEVEYFEEVGTGLGPTLEFYSLVSKEFCKKSLKLWRDEDSEAATEYVSAPQGLYPRPMIHFKGHSDNDKKILKLFRSLGQFIAKAMLDSRIIDVPLSVLFVSQLLGRNRKPHLQLVSSIDPVLARSLHSLQAFVMEKKRIYGLNLPSKERESALKNIEFRGSRLDDMSLDFTLAGYPEVELKARGSNIPVTIYNVEEYIELTLDMTVGRGIEAQIAAFQAGLNCVFAIQNLAGFRSEELVNLFGSGKEDWSYETLVDAVKADHGFRSESRAFKNLLLVMSEFSKEERRQFLQFITGSPKLPIGGFKNLHPPFTVVCKPFEAPLKADDYLPSVMTCANYLKMPDYSCKEVTLAKFKMAYEEGQGSFHLS
ncbi:hypothetical protein BC939DRAFT_451413 [Gamsiella multidivaricata]|uniref:uncharacterized protein n=1 Tax=Gamsiella multidivaricata TaxID=101098 RepID=UPI0022201979|nr:uncharacterized protein BC939DRAFT_451413 [Gamsiella multidivaricata]KAI7823580.1 hypothetical protein BC939DRAFT_451413 [Gamsiella multidivaricata]